jgi:two-component system NtrC family sensor kinase
VTRGVTLAAKGIRARLVRGLGLLGVVVTLLAMGVLLVVGRSSEALRAVEHDARLARDVRALGAGAREQYIHEAHTLVVGDRSHVAHHGRWAEHFRRETRALAAELPAAERPRLDAIVRRSVEVEQAFAREIVPAVDRGDRAGLSEAHERVEAMVVEMIGPPTTSATTSSGGPAAPWPLRRALQRLALGFALGIVARGLRGERRDRAGRLARRGVSAAAHAARGGAVAAGDGEARVGPLPVPELDVVGRAFDQMLDRLKARKSASWWRPSGSRCSGRIAAGVAHELNNPIGVIRGYVKTMRAEAHERAARARARDPR